MSATIRLTRMGKKKRPFYRLVVVDSRTRRDGAYLANLGYYNPFVEPPEVELRAPEIVDWLKKGATVSESARALLRREGVLFRFSLVKQGLSDDEVEQRVAEWRQGAEARMARDEQERQRRRQQVELAETKRREEAAEAKAAEAAEAAAAAGGGDGESANQGESAGEGGPEGAEGAAGEGEPS
ncbi:MAG: 30S ribosomal protein S16 [Candidatus Krumholzibacteriia bacterium]